MYFAPSSTQDQLKNSVRRFCSDEYNNLSQRTLHLRSGQSAQRNHWQTFAALGWLSIATRCRSDDESASAVDTAIILEEFGRALVIEPYLHCGLFASHLIGYYDADQYPPNLLEKIADGSLVVTVAHEEMNQSGFPHPCATRASRAPDGNYAINGRKDMVLGADCADKLIVSAVLDSDNSSDRRVSLFIVDRDREGVQRNEFRLLDGTSGCSFDFTNVQVRDSERVGPIGAGDSALEYAIDQLNVGYCAELVGIIDGVLWTTRDHLRLRRQYGVSLGSLQALQHRMADMFVEAELARSMLYRSLDTATHTDCDTRRAATLAAYLQILESGEYVCRNGIQLHGAMGMTDEHMVGLYFKRLKVITKLSRKIDTQLDQFAALAHAPYSATSR